MDAPIDVAEPPELDWSGHDIFAHAAFALLQSTEDPALERIDANLMVLHGDRHMFVLVRYSRELEAKLADLVAHLVSQQNPGVTFEIAVIGGDERVASLVERARPGQASTRLYHLPQTAGGAFEAPRTLLGHGRSQLHTVLEAARQRKDQNIDAHFAQQSADAARTAFVERARQQREFRVLLNARKPTATYGIVALIVATFLLQFLAAPLRVNDPLIEMGALSRERVLEGEWWRLASATLLHGSLMHVAFNSYVLFALGSLVERLLGTPRFLILYVVSGIAASCGSLLLNSGVSVGASGAIWGLLGAEAALAFGPNQLLPPTIRKSAQRATVVNLLLNALVSFLPRVDWAAHFVGGAAGALLVFSGMFLPPAARSVRRDGIGWRSLATLLCCAFFGAALFGVSRPWL